MQSKTPIKFLFIPGGGDGGANTVEKSDDSGRKRRYLSGISSGSKWDAHGERMSEKCIKGFMEQANSGDVLLYPDQHGIKSSEDIGILAHARVLPDGDWYTEYRLYDETDEVDSRAVEVADKLWKQVNGLPPYKNKREKGFSIEGYVPPDGVRETTEKGGRVIDEVLLDGVLLVPRPAYQSSVAQAVYKALGIDPPWADEKTIQGRLGAKLRAEEMMDAYYRRRYDIQEAVDSLVEEIMREGDLQTRRDDLGRVFDEYQALMIELLLKSEGMFQRGSDPLPLPVARSVDVVNKALRELDALTSKRSQR